MVADPEPHDVGPLLHSEGSIAQSDANRSEAADALEGQRRMARFHLEKFEVGVGEPANLIGHFE